MSLKETVYMSGIIKLRRGTAEDLKGIVLALGEPAFETNSYKLKIGDGETAYESLKYINDYDDLRKLLNENYQIPQDLQEVLNYLKENGDIKTLLGKIKEIETAQDGVNQSLKTLENSLKEKDDNIEANLNNAIKALEDQDTQLQDQIDDTKNRIKTIEDLDVASKEYVDKTKSSLENVIESQIKGEPIVPINDIYNVFKTYWHARENKNGQLVPALAYSSMLADVYGPIAKNSTYVEDIPEISFKNTNKPQEEGQEPVEEDYINPDKEVLEDFLNAKLSQEDGQYYLQNTKGKKLYQIPEGGKYNSMYFGNELSSEDSIPRYALLSKITDRREIDEKMTTVVTGYKVKYGQPINCSTLSALLTLGIPYQASKYSDNWANKVQEDAENTDLEDDHKFKGNRYKISELKDTFKSDKYFNPKEHFNSEDYFKYSFNMYGADSEINEKNYEAYFIARRQLARFRELGLEIPALSQDWWPKYKENEGWYDYIQPTSDLREAQPGDLVFWNTHGENLDPRDVTHVVMVLARLSYDSRNPNQPLLLLAEATSSADLGVQVSYYMYDISDQKEMIENYDSNSKVNKYIQLNNIINTSSITDWRYIYDSDSGNYRFSPKTGDYIRIPYYIWNEETQKYVHPSGQSIYAKLINGKYIEYTEEVQRACQTVTAEGDYKGTYCLKYYDENKSYNPQDPDNLNKSEICYHPLILKDDDETKPKTYIIRRNADGTRENRIPKFICRPKYTKIELDKEYSTAEELTKYPYSDELTDGYAIDNDLTDPYSLKIIGTFIRGNPKNAENNVKCGEVISLEFDWETVKVEKSENGYTPFDPDTVGEHYLSFVKKRTDENDEIVYEDMIIHSIPYCLPNTKYEKVRFVIPLESYLSSSKGNQTDYIDDTIYIQEIVKNKNGEVIYRGKPAFDFDDNKFKIYKGIIQT